MVREKKEREGKAKKAGDEAEGNEGKRKKRELGANERRKREVIKSEGKGQIERSGEKQGGEDRAKNKNGKERNEKGREECEWGVKKSEVVGNRARPGTWRNEYTCGIYIYVISVRFDERNGKGRRENGRGMHQQNCGVGKINDKKSTAYSKTIGW